jgi:hypothetical protein
MAQTITIPFEATQCGPSECIEMIHVCDFGARKRKQADFWRIPQIVRPPRLQEKQQLTATLRGRAGLLKVVVM